MPKYARRVDSNQPRIVECLRELWLPVKLLSHCPSGVLDLIVGCRGVLYWVEVKASHKEKLTDAEQKTFDLFEGYPVIIATDIEELLSKMGMI